MAELARVGVCQFVRPIGAAGRDGRQHFVMLSGQHRHGQLGESAVLHVRGQAKVGDSRRSRSIIGGEFVAEIIGETKVGHRVAVLPRLTGQAWIHGVEELRIDPGDPFAPGFAL